MTTDIAMAVVACTLGGLTVGYCVGFFTGWRYYTQRDKEMKRLRSNCGL